jgi:predicted metal-dependent HD superfamily phosphohydrolase
MTTLAEAELVVEKTLAPLLKGSKDQQHTQARSIIAALSTLYGMPRRHYHTWGHALRMIRSGLELFGDLLPEEVIAIVFHDAIYWKGSMLNEFASAQLIPVMLRPAGVSGPLIDKAVAIVQATKHFMEPQKVPKLAQRVCDLDLVSLATTDWDEFMQDRNDINAEFGCTLHESAGFLKQMLQRFPQEGRFFIDLSDELNAQAIKNIDWFCQHYMEAANVG